MVSSNRWPRPAGMLPVRLLLARFNRVTRLGVPPVVNHAQLPIVVPSVNTGA